MHLSYHLCTHNTLRTTEQNFMNADAHNFTEQLSSNFNLFMLITHSSWPLYMKIYTSFCASASLICKCVSVLALQMCTVPIRLDFNDTARIWGKHTLPTELNLQGSKCTTAAALCTHFLTCYSLPYSSYPSPFTPQPAEFCVHVCKRQTIWKCHRMFEDCRISYLQSQ